MLDSWEMIYELPLLTQHSLVTNKHQRQSYAADALKKELDKNSRIYLSTCSETGKESTFRAWKRMQWARNECFQLAMRMVPSTHLEKTYEKEIPL